LFVAQFVLKMKVNKKICFEFVKDIKVMIVVPYSSVVQRFNVCDGLYNMKMLSM